MQVGMLSEWDDFKTNKMFPSEHSKYRHRIVNEVFIWHNDSVTVSGYILTSQGYFYDFMKVGPEVKTLLRKSFFLSLEIIDSQEK